MIVIIMLLLLMFMVFHFPVPRSRYALRLGGFVSPLVVVIDGVSLREATLRDYIGYVQSCLDTVSEVFDNMVGLETLALWRPSEETLALVERISDTAWLGSCFLNLCVNLHDVLAKLKRRERIPSRLARAFTKDCTDVYMATVWAMNLEGHPPFLMQIAGLTTASIQLFNGWKTAGRTLVHFHK